MLGHSSSLPYFRSLVAALLPTLQLHATTSRAGLREFTLVSGERHRLRFVLPWARGTVMDFLSDKESPGYLQDPTARKRVHYVCGGVLRSLFDATRAVGLYGTSPADLDKMEGHMRSDMEDSCKKWMAEASPDILEKCKSSIANLVRGSARWKDLKPAYDQGLVALAPLDRAAVPVSSVAASVLHAALAKLLRASFKPLDEEDVGSRRGFALEAQLHAVLDPCTRRAIPTFSLDGRARSKAVTLRADYALPFLTATETTPAATTSVLYLPKASGYPCDAIIVPAANSDLTEPVVLLESSVTPPTDDGRLNKLLAWFKAAPPQCKAAKRKATQADSAEAKRAPEEFGGFIDMVKAAHPTRPVVAVLCWLGRCEAGGDSGDGGAGHADGAAASVAADGAGGAAKTKQSTKQKQPESKKQRLTEAAKAKGVELCVLDTSGLHILGVRTTR